MKILLISGVIGFCVLGFLCFLWIISKKQDKTPIESLKEDQKKEYDFVKNQQKGYSVDSSEIQKIEQLNIHNRGALYEKAIARKKNEYRDDDIEYQNRIEQKTQSLPQEFEPKQHSLSSFIKQVDEPKEEVEKQQKKEEIKELKQKVEAYEHKKEKDFEQFKAEILLEAENIKKKRKELLLSSNAME